MTTERVRRSWPEVLDALSRLKRATWTLVSQYAQVLDYDGTRLLLGFSSPGIAATFSKGAHLEFVRHALIESIGLDARIEAVADGAPASPRAASGSAQATPTNRGSGTRDQQNPVVKNPTNEPTEPATARANLDPTAWPEPAPIPGNPVVRPEPTPPAPEVGLAESASAATDHGSIKPFQGASAQTQSPPQQQSTQSQATPTQAEPAKSAPNRGSSGRERVMAASAGGVRHKISASEVDPPGRPLNDEPPPDDEPPPEDDAVFWTPAPARQIAAADDRDISIDDPNIESSGLIGQPLVEQILGGTVIEEHEQ